MRAEITLRPEAFPITGQGTNIYENGAVQIGMTAMSIGPVPPARVGKLGAQAAKISHR